MKLKLVRLFEKGPSDENGPSKEMKNSHLNVYVKAIFWIDPNIIGETSLSRRMF